MNKRRIISSIIVASVALFTFIGCSKSTTKDNRTTKIPTTTTQTHVTTQHYDAVLTNKCYINQDNGMIVRVGLADGKLSSLIVLPTISEGILMKVETEGNKIKQLTSYNQLMERPNAAIKIKKADGYCPIATTSKYIDTGSYDEFYYDITAKVDDDKITIINFDKTIEISINGTLNDSFSELTSTASTINNCTFTYNDSILNMIDIDGETNITLEDNKYIFNPTDYKSAIEASDDGKVHIYQAHIEGSEYVNHFDMLIELDEDGYYKKLTSSFFGSTPNIVNYSYNADRSIVTISNDNGKNVTTFDKGKIINFISYDNNNNNVTMESSMIYDDLGNFTEYIETHGTSCAKSVYEYVDGTSILSKLTFFNKNITELNYNENTAYEYEFYEDGNLEAYRVFYSKKLASDYYFEYDEAGNKTLYQCYKYSNGNLTSDSFKEEYSYDELGRKESALYYNLDSSYSDWYLSSEYNYNYEGDNLYFSNYSCYEYYENGNECRYYAYIVDSEGHEQTLEYTEFNELGNPTIVKKYEDDMEIEVTEYVYDEDNETITEETICSYKKINNKKVLVRSESYTYTDDYYIEHDVEYYTGTDYPSLVGNTYKDLTYYNYYDDEAPYKSEQIYYKKHPTNNYFIYDYIVSYDANEDVDGKMTHKTIHYDLVGSVVVKTKTTFIIIDLSDNSYAKRYYETYTYPEANPGGFIEEKEVYEFFNEINGYLFVKKYSGHVPNTFDQFSYCDEYEYTITGNIAKVSKHTFYSYYDNGKLYEMIIEVIDTDSHDVIERKKYSYSYQSGTTDYEETEYNDIGVTGYYTQFRTVKKDVDGNELVVLFNSSYNYFTSHYDQTKSGSYSYVDNAYRCDKIRKIEYDEDGNCYRVTWYINDYDTNSYKVYLLKNDYLNMVSNAWENLDNYDFVSTVEDSVYTNMDITNE